MTTRGDQILDRTLAKVGGKGLFVKELETALADRRADLAVHSLKDVPMDLPPGFALAAVLEREDARDACVSSRYAGIDAVAAGRRASARRACAGSSSCAALRPDLRLEPLRGNLDTRLRKLDDGQYDAIVLAAAGLVRLGLAARIRDRFAATRMLPCAGQGALGDRGARRRRRSDRTAGQADASRRRGSRSRPSAPSRAPSAAAAACRSRRTPRGSARRSSCTPSSAIPPIARRPCCARAIAGPAADEQAAEALGTAAALELRAAGAAPYLAAAESLGADADRE